VDVFVAPFKVMNYSLVCQFLLHNEDILEKVDDSFLDIKVIELSYHSLLVLKVLLILVNQSIPLINDASNIVEDESISISLKGR
jgi:hypothetical protein